MLFFETEWKEMLRAGSNMHIKCSLWNASGLLLNETHGVTIWPASGRFLSAGQTSWRNARETSMAYDEEILSKFRTHETQVWTGTNFYLTCKSPNVSMYNWKLAHGALVHIGY